MIEIVEIVASKYEYGRGDWIEVAELRAGYSPKLGATFNYTFAVREYGPEIAAKLEEAIARFGSRATCFPALGMKCDIGSTRWRFSRAAESVETSHAFDGPPENGDGESVDPAPHKRPVTQRDLNRLRSNLQLLHNTEWNGPDTTPVTVLFSVRELEESFRRFYYTSKTTGVQRPYFFVESATGDVYGAKSWDEPGGSPCGNIFEDGDHGIGQFGTVSDTTEKTE